MGSPDAWNYGLLQIIQAAVLLSKFDFHINGQSVPDICFLQIAQQERATVGSAVTSPREYHSSMSTY